MNSFFFFFNDTATTEIYTLSLHDALPIFEFIQEYFKNEEKRDPSITEIRVLDTYWSDHCRHTTFLTERSEEHTSELQSRQYLVCRLLLEKKKNYYYLHARCQGYMILLINS